MPAARAPKRYDAAYYRRWYRDPRTRVHVRGSLERKVRLAVHVAEYLLERPIRSVLDVGCGEGPWQPVLARLRPGVRYAGVDSSEYAVKRWGRRRNLRLGTFGRLEEAGLEGPYDLVVCSDVLHYVPAAELLPGLRALRAQVGGVAWIELFTAADRIEGDHHALQLRPPAHYQKLFRRVGLVPMGLYAFVPADFAPGTTAFERGRPLR